MALGPVYFTDDTLAVTNMKWPSHYIAMDFIQGFPDPFKPPGPFAFFKLLPPIVSIQLQSEYFIVHRDD